jgi:hypothetical protein
MGWEDGDFAEEMVRKVEDVPGYFCPWCKKETDLWFDRSFVINPDGTDDGMKDRCVDCGRATDEIPEETSLFKDDIGEAEADGG